MTQAIKSHGTLLKMGDGGSAGAPISLTSTIHDDDSDFTLILAATAHGFHDGQPVTIAGVTTATECNGAWAVDVVNSLYFSIPVGTTADGSSGTATPTSENFTTVGEVKDITGPGLDRATFDVTTHDSPNDYDEFMIGVKNSGEVSFSINWNPSLGTHDGTTGLKKQYDDGVLTNFQLFNTALDHLDFAAYVTGFAPKFPVSGVVEADVKLKVTGNVVLVVHS